MEDVTQEAFSNMQYAPHRYTTWQPSECHDIASMRELIVLFWCLLYVFRSDACCIQSLQEAALLCSSASHKTRYHS